MMHIKLVEGDAPQPINFTIKNPKNWEAGTYHITYRLENPDGSILEQDISFEISYVKAVRSIEL